MPKRITQYTVKNVKTFRGMEGPGYNANLYRNRKKVAQVDDDAQGGPLRYHWLDYASPRVPLTIINHEGKPWEMKVTPEEKLFIAHVRAHTKERFEPEDMFVHNLVDGVLEDRQYKKWCRTKVCFRLKKHADGEWATIKGKYNAAYRRHLQSKYGDDLVEILNERFTKETA